MIQKIPPVKFAQARLLVTKAILDSLQNIGELAFNSQGFDMPMSDMLIQAAIFIGQAECRPLTSGDIAVYLKIPRATVIRRLKLLSGTTPLRTCKDGKRVCYYFDNVNNEQSIHAFAKRLAIFQRLARDLSKLDTKEIDALLPTVYTGTGSQPAS